ncbi:MAG: hypothetical protein Q9228_003728 [Teloschistes exilis]
MPPPTDPTFQHSDEDWTQITQPRLRKRVQNRVSQRKHRNKIRQQREVIDGAGAQAPSVDADPSARSYPNSSTSSARSSSRGDIQFVDQHTSWPASSAPAYSMVSPYGLGISAATSGQSPESMYYPGPPGSTGHPLPYSSPSIPSIVGPSGGVPQYDLPQYHYPPSTNPYTLPTDYRSSLYPEPSYSGPPNSWNNSPEFESSSHATRRHLTPEPLPQPMLTSSSLYDPYSAPSAMASTSAATIVASSSAISASSRYPGSRSNSTLYDDPHGASVDSRYYEDSGKYRSHYTSKQTKTSHRRHK